LNRRVTAIGGVPVKEPTFVYAVNRLRLDGRRGRTIFTYLRPPGRPAARAAGRLRPHG
jgi:hypothetical protein